jgi:hypothetical protein
MSTGEHGRLECCEKGSTLLSDYLDGKFPPDSPEAQKIEAHLAECLKCAEMLDDYKALSAAARLLRDCGEDCVDVVRMKSAVRRDLRRAVIVSRAAWVGAGLSAAAAVAAAVVAFVVPTRPERTPALAEDREKRIETIVAELQARPRDVEDVRVRQAVLDRLREDERVGRVTTTLEWLALFEEAGLDSTQIDVDVLVNEVRAGGGIEVVPVKE